MTPENNTSDLAALREVVKAKLDSDQPHIKLHTKSVAALLDELDRLRTEKESEVYAANVRGFNALSELKESESRLARQHLALNKVNARVEELRREMDFDDRYLIGFQAAAVMFMEEDLFEAPARLSLTEQVVEAARDAHMSLQILSQSKLRGVAADRLKASIALIRDNLATTLEALDTQPSHTDECQRNDGTGIWTCHPSCLNIPAQPSEKEET